MRVPRKYIDSFTSSVNFLSADMRGRLSAELEKVSLDDVSAARDAIIAIMQAFCGAYTDMAAMLGAEFYDGLRAMSLGSAIGAVAESGWEPEAEDAAVRALIQGVVDGGGSDALISQLLDRADAEVRRSANESVARNARRDKVKVGYARVPSGIETCKWCLMIASKGPSFRSMEIASHSHANCDCRVVPDFGDGIQGYNPDYYYDVWKHPEKYPEYREARNARRRELYAIKQTSTGGSVSVDVDKIVPCLEDARTGEILKTNVSRMTKSELKGYNIRTGWGANWQKKASSNEVYALRIDGSDEVHGLVAVRAESGANAVYIDFAKAAPHSDPTMVKEKRYNGIGGHLFAIAAKRSEQLGYDGAIYGDAANKELLNLYERKFGAINIPIFHIYRFIIEPKDAMAILDEYSFDWKG